MLGFRPPDGRSSADVAVALQAVFALLLTLATLAALVVLPSLGSAPVTGGGEQGLDLPVSIGKLGFSPVDALMTILVAFTALSWLWVVADVVCVTRPLARGDLLGAEAPALLLGMAQTVFGGLIPGLLLLVSSRRTRNAIRQIPALEAERSDIRHVPSGDGQTLARALGRGAMVGLGVLWGIAGFSMFQNRFYLYLPSLVTTASQGAPGFLGGWFGFWAFLMSLGAQPAVYVAGALQLLLAFALVAGFARKMAYFGGLFVAVFLWIVPEAFGGPFTGGAFSLGPGLVYAIGLIALIALNGTYGVDVATLDGIIERRFPRWGRIAEVSVGLVPQIGRWYVRNARRLARGAEVAFGVFLAASAAVALATNFGGQLAGLLASRTGTASGPLGAWYALWAHLFSGVGPGVAAAIVGIECALAVAFILGAGRKSAYVIGLGLSLFLWAVVEGFGGVPGPGYTDPGVGIAEALVLLALLGIVAARGAERPTLDYWAGRRLRGWARIASFARPQPSTA